MFAKADAYEHFMGRWSRQLATELIGFAGGHAGDRILDVGSGTGSLAFTILEADAAAQVVGIDPSEDFVAAATRRGNARASFEVGDAQRLRFPAATFDRAMALLVLNFVPDPGRALDEMVRVTKPGGVVAAAVWDYGEGMELLRIFFDEATAIDPAVAEHDEKHMPLSQAGELGALWRAHGLADVRETPLVITMHFASFDDYWKPFLLGAGPSGAYVVKLPPERRAALERRLRARLPAGAFDLHARAWAVTGVVKARAP